MNDLQEWGEMKLESPKGWQWADFSGVGEPDSDSDDDDEEDEEGGRQDEHVVDDEGHEGGPQDGSESDFENETPRGRTRRRANPSAGATLTTAPEAMHLDPQAQAQQAQQTPQAQAQTTPIPPHQNTPTLNRPTPRLPFASLSENTPTQPPRSTNQRKQPKMPVLRAHLVQIKILENHQNGKDTHLRGLQIFALDDEKQQDMGVGRSGGGGGVIGGLGGVGDGQDKHARKGKGRGLSGGLGRSEWDAEPSIR